VKKALIGVLTVAALAAWAAESDLGKPAVREGFYRSYGFERAQNLPEAIKAMEALRKADPTAYAVNLRLAWLYYLSGDYNNSKTYYLAAVQSLPGTIEPKLGLILPLLAQKRYEEAESAAKQVLQLDPRNYLGNLRLAVALRLQAKHEQAEKVLAGMLGLYPTDLELLAEMGLNQAARGDKKAATWTFNELLTLSPENIAAKQYLAAKP
jgi:Flp pilus assembly protein TadD